MSEKKKRKKEKTQQSNTQQSKTQRFMWFDNVPTSMKSSAPHHHIDHEITRSIQAATSFDLSWFLFSKPLSIT